MWQNQDHTVELLPRSFMWRLGKAAVILVLFALLHLSCQMGFAETLSEKPCGPLDSLSCCSAFTQDKGVLLCELRQCKQSVLCYSEWDLTNSCRNHSARFPGSWGGGVEICDFTSSLLFKLRWCRLGWASELQLQFCPWQPPRMIPVRGKSSKLLYLCCS